MVKFAKRMLGVLAVMPTLALAGASEPREDFERNRARAQAEYDTLCNPDPQIKAARLAREAEAERRTEEERARALRLPASTAQKKIGARAKNIVLCKTVP